MRFNHEATTHEEAEQYLRNRGRQLLYFGYRFRNVLHDEQGVWMFFFQGKKVFQSYYLLKQFRGNNLYAEKLKEFPYPVVTLPACGLYTYLERKSIKHVCEWQLLPSYELIEQYYGDQKAARSGVHYMNHIDEGLAIMELRGVSKRAQEAFCLHPIFQMDSDLKKNWYKYTREDEARAIQKDTLLMSLEYRNIANQYLSHRKISSIGEIALSPIQEVNEMLIADKVQNYKDFQIYHKDHSRYAELDQYFKNWLERLEIDYERLKKEIL